MDVLQQQVTGLKALYDKLQLDYASQEGSGKQLFVVQQNLLDRLQLQERQFALETAELKRAAESLQREKDKLLQDGRKDLAQLLDERNQAIEGAIQESARSAAMIQELQAELAGRTKLAYETVEARNAEIEKLKKDLQKASVRLDDIELPEHEDGPESEGHSSWYNPVYDRNVLMQRFTDLVEGKIYGAYLDENVQEAARRAAYDLTTKELSDEEFKIQLANLSAAVNKMHNERAQALSQPESPLAGVGHVSGRLTNLMDWFARNATSSFMPGEVQAIQKQGQDLQTKLNASLQGNITNPQELNRIVGATETFINEFRATLRGKGFKDIPGRY